MIELLKNNQGTINLRYWGCHLERRVTTYTHIHKLYIYTLQGINISHLGKRKIIFKMDFSRDMLVPRRVYVLYHISQMLHVTGINLPTFQLTFQVKCRYMGVSKNRVPQIIHFNRVFHYKPSILGYPYCWKRPYIFQSHQSQCGYNFFMISHLLWRFLGTHRSVTGHHIPKATKKTSLIFLLMENYKCYQMFSTYSGNLEPTISPQKLTWNPKMGGLEDDLPFFKQVIFRFGNVSFQGCIPPKSFVNMFVVSTSFGMFSSCREVLQKGPQPEGSIGRCEDRCLEVSELMLLLMAEIRREFPSSRRLVVEIPSI